MEGSVSASTADRVRFRVSFTVQPVRQIMPKFLHTKSSYPKEVVPSRHRLAYSTKPKQGQTNLSTRKEGSKKSSVHPKHPRRIQPIQLSQQHVTAPYSVDWVCRVDWRHCTHHGGGVLTISRRWTKLRVLSCPLGTGTCSRSHITGPGRACCSPDRLIQPAREGRARTASIFFRNHTP
jgi:hypothetical protein